MHAINRNKNGIDLLNFAVDVTGKFGGLALLLATDGKNCKLRVYCSQGCNRMFKAKKAPLDQIFQLCNSALLVPQSPDVMTQVIDVRDLAAFIVASAERGTTGTYNTVGPVLPFLDWVELARTVAGHNGPVVYAEAAWLLEQGVSKINCREFFASR